MTTPKTLIQVVTGLPPNLDGVGDQALHLALNLRERSGIETRFIVGDPTWPGATEIMGFSVSKVADRSAGALVRELRSSSPPWTVLLHYVPYGFSRRGVPFWLLEGLRQWGNLVHGKPLCGEQPLPLITMFHELAATGAPWKSAFWLGPLQVRIAVELIRLSRCNMVSNHHNAAWILAHVPAASTSVHPVVSNFGEPSLDEGDLAARDPSRWVICGGRHLCLQSLGSFAKLRQHIPPAFRPTHLDVVGGADCADIRTLLAQMTDLASAYYPMVTPQRASELLAQASFAWIDYFGAGPVTPSLVYKSATLGSVTAHGVIPILGHVERGQVVGATEHPGHFHLTSQGHHFPEPGQVTETRQGLLHWYHHHGCLVTLGRIYEKVLVG